LFGPALAKLNVSPIEVVTDATLGLLPGYSTRWSRRPGITSSSVRTNVSRPTTAASHTDDDPCEGYAPTAPLK
jgi:hypothetical protein